MTDPKTSWPITLLCNRSRQEAEGKKSCRAHSSTKIKPAAQQQMLPKIHNFVQRRTAGASQMQVMVSHGVCCHFIVYHDWLKANFGRKVVGVASSNQLRRFWVMSFISRTLWMEGVLLPMCRIKHVVLNVTDLTLKVNLL